MAVSGTSEQPTRRRTFLRTGLTAGVVVGLAGCTSNADESRNPTATTQGSVTTTEESTTTETTDDEQTTEEPEIDRPANYRWDMKPGRNEKLRSELGQHVEGDVGEVVQTHPAFDYATDTERDDHTVDFAALKLFRDTQYDILKRNGTSGMPWETYVESFVNDDIYEAAKTDNFIQHDTSAPPSYDSEAWLNAETVEDSLDLAHSFLGSKVPQQQIGPAEQGTILREAYERHHKFDVLAWETNMGFQTGYDDRITGLMYSPDDDKIRAHDVSPPTEVGTGGTGVEASRKWHSEIQEWDIFDDGGELFHPLLFHTDEWNRQNPGFMAAKDEAVAAIAGIAADTAIGYGAEIEEAEGPGGLVNNLTITTGALKQLTRTMLEYNERANDSADFGDVQDLANFAVGQYLQDPSINGVLDTVGPNEEYDEYFDGGFSFYEVADENIVKTVRQDRNGQYDNFGQSYDGLAVT